MAQQHEQITQMLERRRKQQNGLWCFRRVGSGGTDAHVRDDGRHCPMHVDAAPEVRSMAAQRLANG